MKPLEKIKAREFRNIGYSISRIAKTLNISKSTATKWTSDIKLNSEQLKLLESNIHRASYERSQKQIKNAREQRLEYQNEGRRLASKKEVLHNSGCMLYWAEGSKSKNTLEFTNSDVQMMIYFKSFLDIYFKPSKYRIQCNFYTDIHSKDQIEKYWLDNLNLNLDSLGKSSINNHSKYSKQKKKGKSPYGTCKLVVCNTKIVQHIFGAIQEYIGNPEPKWLF